LKNWDKETFEEIGNPCKSIGWYGKEGIRGCRFSKITSKELDSDIKSLKNIYETAGHSFNLASPKQLRSFIWQAKKLAEPNKRNQNGQYATGEEVLSYLANDNPIVKDILNWRN
jgi:DNA polymerase-1